MITFTVVDYWRYQSVFPITHTLHDTEEKYQLEKTYQYHDKIFKEILDSKEEFVHFIKKYTNYKPKIDLIQKEHIEKYNRKFITTNFTARESDMIYKIKEKNVFFIIEQQSKIDHEMPNRITEYCVELIRSVVKEKRDLKRYPLIIPIVLYTGKKRWNAPRSLSDVQEKQDGFEPLNYPKYNLVDIHDFSKEKLMEDRSSIAKAMLFEKLKTKEEMEETIEALIRKKLTKEEKKYIKIMLNYSNDIRKKLSPKEINEYKKIIEKEGGKNMTNFEKLFIELLDEKHEKQRIAEEKGMQRGMQRGMQKGIEKGRRDGIIQIIKEMIRKQLSDEIIIDTTKIDKKELQKLKEELKVC